MTDTARLTAALPDRYRVERELGEGCVATVYLQLCPKPDDRSFLFVRPKPGDQSQLIMVTNWFEELKTKVGQ